MTRERVIIPDRSASNYANQYAGATAERCAEIFADSYQIALRSSNPETATDRYHLAIEAYHQIQAADPTLMLAAVVRAAMEELVEVFQGERTGVDPGPTGAEIAGAADLSFMDPPELPAGM